MKRGQPLCLPIAKYASASNSPNSVMHGHLSFHQLDKPAHVAAGPKHRIRAEDASKDYFAFIARRVVVATTRYCPHGRKQYRKAYIVDTVFIEP